MHTCAILSAHDTWKPLTALQSQSRGPHPQAVLSSLMERLVYSYIITQSYRVLEGHGFVFLKYFKLCKCWVSAISSVLRCRAVAILREDTREVCVRAGGKQTCPFHLELEDILLICSEGWHMGSFLPPTFCILKFLVVVANLKCHSSSPPPSTEPGCSFRTHITTTPCRLIGQSQCLTANLFSGLNSFEASCFIGENRGFMSCTRGLTANK